MSIFYPALLSNIRVNFNTIQLACWNTETGSGGKHVAASRHRVNNISTQRRIRNAH
jgi:hypothetical protein